MAISKKTTNSRLDFAQAVKDGVEYIETSEQTEMAPVIVEPVPSPDPEKPKPPQKTGPVSLKQQLQEQKLIREQTDEVKDIKPEVNQTVKKLAISNSIVDDNDPILRKARKGGTGRPKTIYFTTAVYEYLDRWLEEGYTLSSVVNYIIYQYMKEEQNNPDRR